jgi:hypothetical protein
MVSEDLLNELAIVYYTSYDFPRNGNYTDEDFLLISQKKEDWKALSIDEKNIIKEKARSWAEAYKQRFPEQFEIISNNWRKIDW